MLVNSRINNYANFTIAAFVLLQGTKGAKGEKGLKGARGSHVSIKHIIVNLLIN